MAYHSIHRIISTESITEAPKIRYVNNTTQTLYFSQFSLQPLYDFLENVGKIRITINGTTRYESDDDLRKLQALTIHDRIRDLPRDAELMVYLSSGIYSERVTTSVTIDLDREPVATATTAIPLDYDTYNEIHDTANSETQRVIDKLTAVQGTITAESGLDDTNIVNKLDSAISHISELESDNDVITARLTAIRTSVDSGAFSPDAIVSEIDELITEVAKIETDTLGILNAKKIIDTRLAMDDATDGLTSTQRLNYQTLQNRINGLLDGFDKTEIASAILTLDANKSSVLETERDPILTLLTNLRQLQKTDTVDVVSKLVEVKTSVDDLEFLARTIPLALREIDTEQAKSGLATDYTAALTEAETVLTGLRDGWSDEELRRTVTTLREVLPLIRSTNNDLGLVIDEIFVNLEIVNNNNKQSLTKTLIQTKTLNNKTEHYAITLDGARSMILMISTSAPLSLTPTYPDVIDVSHTIDTSALYVKGYGSGAPDSNTEKIQVGRALVNNTWTPAHVYFNYNGYRQTFGREYVPNSEDRIISFRDEQFVVNETTVDFDFDLGSAKTIDLRWIDNCYDPYKVQIDAVDIRTDASNYAYHCYFYSGYFLTCKARIGDATQSDYSDIEWNGDNEIIDRISQPIRLTKRYIRFELRYGFKRFAEIRGGFLWIPHATQRPANPVDMTAYDIDDEQDLEDLIYGFHDTNTSGGTATMKLQIKNKENQWLDYITDDSMTDMAVGTNVVANLGENVSGRPLPLDPDTFRAQIKTTGNIKVSASYQLGF